MVKHYRHYKVFEKKSCKQIDKFYLTGLAELGTQSAQLRTHFYTNWQLKPAFSKKKNFENPSKID